MSLLKTADRLCNISTNPVPADKRYRTC